MVEIRAKIESGDKDGLVIGQELAAKGRPSMPDHYPGMSAYAGLFTCPDCGKPNHFSYNYLSSIDSLDEKRKCSHCGKTHQLREYKPRTRSFAPTE